MMIEARHEPEVRKERPMETGADAQRKVYISEAAGLLDRREHTLRTW